MKCKLAIHGGKPVREKMLHYGRQSMDERDIEKVIEVLKSDYLTTGPMVKKFENSVAKYVGAKYAVAVANGTAALHMACFAAGIKKGDEVIVSPLTFAASANCILYCGGKPVFADIDPLTYNIDPDSVLKKITTRTKAIIIVDFAGQTADLDKLKKIAKDNSLILIEDAAHALGSKYNGRLTGSLADMTEFSFHPVKPITTGEGGLVTTNNNELYNKMILFRSHGITRDEELIDSTIGDWYYEQLFLGYNYRLTDIQAALGVSQMNKIDDYILRRKYIAKIYNETFSKDDSLIIPFQADESDSGWHIYVLRLNVNKLKVGRKEIFNALKAENIGVNVHYIPVYMHPYYKKLGYDKGLCPIAEEVYNEILTLPIYPGMKDEDIKDVIEAVNKVINYYRK